MWLPGFVSPKECLTGSFGESPPKKECNVAKERLGDGRADSLMKDLVQHVS